MPPPTLPIKLNYPNPAPDSVINGRYQLLDTIGRGSTAVVWSAWDTHLKRIVALKLISSGHKKLNIADFEREARTISALEHPHIVPLYDYGVSDDTYYLATRYLTGGTLADQLYQAPLTPAEVIACMSRIALALDYVHDQRVIHRDLKPGNILLDAQRMPYLADFGLAKSGTGQDEDHSVSGTLNFMAPEQFVGRVSAASDSFAFGVMLYQVFTGTLPYNGDQALGMLMLTEMQKLPDIQSANPALPKPLNDFLQRLTHPDPTRRPVRLAPLIPELESLFGLQHGIDNLAIPVTPVSVIDRDTYNADGLLAKIESAAPTNLSAATLTLTDFLVLDTYLRTHPQALSPAAATIMLETALHFDRDVDRWGSYWLRLSSGMPLPARVAIFARLIARELLRGAPESRSLFIVTVAGSVVAFALQLYAVITPNPVTGDIRLLNASGNGLLFGLIMGCGLFLGMHMARRLRVFPLALGTGLGWMVSSLVIAIAFSLFQKLFYLDVLDPSVAFASALLYSAGFVWASHEHPVVQSVFGIIGVVAGYIIPFWLYFNEQIERAPFIFRYEDTTYGVPLVILCALILALFINFKSLIRLYRRHNPRWINRRLTQTST